MAPSIWRACANAIAGETPVRPFNQGQYARITLDFDDDERRQLQTNMRNWRQRLDQFDRDLTQEPRRIRAFYDVQATRVEPVGLVYLWPEPN